MDTNRRDCETEIRLRLIAALRAEGLLPQEGRAARCAEEVINRDVPPAALLRNLAEEQLLTVVPTNLDRACAEITDSVLGLQRARQGIRKRWEDQNSAGGYDKLIEALGARSERLFGYHDASSLLARCEQLVCEGHPASPAAKTTLGIGEEWAQVLPEQTETIKLRFVAVNPQKVTTRGLSTLEAMGTYLPQLAAELGEELHAHGLSEYTVIPVHPFQWEHVIEQEFSVEIAHKEVVLLDTTAIAEPLMSVRTLRVSDGIGAMHVKVAVEIQLTGAIRGISAGAVAAPLISEKIAEVLTLDTGFNPRTVEDEPGFTVARDISAVRWDEEEGVRARCFGAVLREDPAIGLADGEIAMPVATLLARNPLSGKPILADIFEELSYESERYEKWFEKLGRLLFVPSAALVARWGIAIEPHPQNTVIVLREGWPTRVIVRDLGGCRIFVHGAFGGSNVIDSLQGTAILESDLTRLVDKVVYPLISNLYYHLHKKLALPNATRRKIDRSLATLIAEEYWRTRAAQLDLPEDSGEVVFRRFLGETVPLKRVLGMRLSGAVTEQSYVRELNPLSAADLLEETHLRERLGFYLPWAGRELGHRVNDRAKEEKLSTSDIQSLQRDIANAQENLALVRSQVERRVNDRPRSYWDLLRPLLPYQATITADSLGIMGHNVHPLSKLRRGFDLEESAAYGPESGMSVDLRFLAVDRDLIASSRTFGDDSESEFDERPGKKFRGKGFEDVFSQHFPDHIRAAKAYVNEQEGEGKFMIIPVHPWQLHHVIKTAYAEEISAGRIIVIPFLTLAAYPTISLRTLVPHALSALQSRPFIKCAVDVILTSTRRSISQDSALGTPRVARLVDKAIGDLRREAGLNPRVTVVPELAGIAFARAENQSKTRQRGLSVLLRDDTAEYLSNGEIAVSASALRGHYGVLPSPLADIDPEFFDNYVYDLVTTVFGLMFFHGIALEQHLQNTMVRIDLSNKIPVYRGLLLRDFSGLRALISRLEKVHGVAAFERGAITLTDNHEEFLSKGFYACIFGNLEGIIEEYSAARGEDPRHLWGRVRTQVDRVREESQLPIPRDDFAWIERPTIPCKGFLSMGLTESGSDVYWERINPLA